MCISKAETTTWRPVTYGQITYDLSHLNSCALTYEVPQDHGSMRTYAVDVIYSPHCFTRGLPKDGEQYDKNLEYRDGRQTRLFDVGRWHLSKNLPSIISGLLKRTCRFGSSHTQNYFTVDILTKEGALVEYYVFFVVTKSSTKGRLNLFVQSAYLGANLSKSRTIRFQVILAKAAEGKKPRP